jgi:hypothetical protein
MYKVEISLPKPGAKPWKREQLQLPIGEALMAKTEKVVTGDQLPKTEVRQSDPILLKNVSEDDAASESSRIHTAYNDQSAKNAKMRAVLLRWVECHGVTCACELCRATREALI